MGAKKASRKRQNNFTNVVQLNTFHKPKQKQVTILPRNKNQETYMLKLLDDQKDIIFDGLTYHKYTFSADKN